MIPAKEVEPEPAAASVKAGPALSYDPRDPVSKDPFVLPALTADKVRFLGADLVRPPANPESPAAPKALPEPSVPKLGDPVREVATPVPAEPAVSYDPRDRASKDPFLLPALTAGKVRFPGAGLVRPQALPDAPAAPEAQPEPPTPSLGDTVREAIAPAPVEPALSYDPRAPEPTPPKLGAAVRDTAPSPPPVRAKPEVSYEPRDPASKDPFLVPALTASKVRFPGADLMRPQPQAQPAAAAGLGDVVREMAKAAPPAPKLPEVPQPAKAAGPPPAPKVDQSFSFSPTIKLDVQGDVKDPAQLLREMEGGVRELFDAWQREVAARTFSAQLFDQPHV